MAWRRRAGAARFRALAAGPAGALRRRRPVGERAPAHLPRPRRQAVGAKLVYERVAVRRVPLQRQASRRCCSPTASRPRTDRSATTCSTSSPGAPTTDASDAGASSAPRRAPSPARARSAPASGTRRTTALASTTRARWVLGWANERKIAALRAELAELDRERLRSAPSLRSSIASTRRGAVGVATDASPGWTASVLGESSTSPRRRHAPTGTTTSGPGSRPAPPDSRRSQRPGPQRRARRSGSPSGRGPDRQTGNAAAAVRPARAETGSRRRPRRTQPDQRPGRRPGGVRRPRRVGSGQLAANALRPTAAKPSGTLTDGAVQADRAAQPGARRLRPEPRAVHGRGAAALARAAQRHGRHRRSRAATSSALHERVATDDLPRFESEFKRLAQHRDASGARAVQQLAAPPGRGASTSGWPGSTRPSVRSPTTPAATSGWRRSRTDNQEVAPFRADLRNATDDTLSADDDHYSEQRFLDVKRIIERFRGREGYADSDKAWTRRVTDVRNWFVFSASERDLETDEEWEHYSDSDGKSGGQKEKLAYTILAASLAYQFGLEWGAEKSKDFRFAVIDEAFGRGSDVSTRYALELFAKLGLQLLIVTPLQKVHVIEPYVKAIGFVDNPTGTFSRLQTMTIEEYRDSSRRAGTHEPPVGPRREDIAAKVRRRWDDGSLLRALRRSSAVRPDRDAAARPEGIRDRRRPRCGPGLDRATRRRSPRRRRYDARVRERSAGATSVATSCRPARSSPTTDQAWALLGVAADVRALRRDPRARRRRSRPSATGCSTIPIAPSSSHDASAPTARGLSTGSTPTVAPGGTCARSARRASTPSSPRRHRPVLAAMLGVSVDRRRLPHRTRAPRQARAGPDPRVALSSGCHSRSANWRSAATSCAGAADRPARRGRRRERDHLPERRRTRGRDRHLGQGLRGRPGRPPPLARRRRRHLLGRHRHPRLRHPRPPPRLAAADPLDPDGPRDAPRPPRPLGHRRTSRDRQPRPVSRPTSRSSTTTSSATASASGCDSSRSGSTGPGWMASCDPLTA